MRRTTILYRVLFSLLLILGILSTPAPARAASDPKIALLSDIHVTKGKVKTIEELLKKIRQIAHVKLLAILGDVCKDVGKASEYNLVGQALSDFKNDTTHDIMLRAVPGNHDFRYQDEKKKDPEKKKMVRQRGDEALQKAKLNTFFTTMLHGGTVPSPAPGEDYIRFYSETLGNYLLVFLTVDNFLIDASLVGLSPDTCTRLEAFLQDPGNRNKPTILFCHGPVEKTYLKKPNSVLGPKNANVHPVDRINGIIKNNPQVFLWVAGHVHLPPPKTLKPEDTLNRTISTQRRIARETIFGEVTQRLSPELMAHMDQLLQTGEKRQSGLQTIKEPPGQASSNSHSAVWYGFSLGAPSGSIA